MPQTQPITQPTHQVQDPKQALPLLYRQLTVANKEQHVALRIADDPDYRFASQADALPILVSELSAALRHYPLAFLETGPDSTPLLVAITGMANGRNLFVDEHGQWLIGAYVPAYARRYPWFAVQGPDQAEPLLAMDDTATQLSREKGTPLFDEQGQPTERLQQVMAFEREYIALAQRTQAMVQALAQAQVLEPAQLTLSTQGDEPRQLNGLMVVSEARLQQLTPEALATLHAADALGMAYAQLLSMGNFVHLPISPETAQANASQNGRKARAQKSKS